MMRGGNGTQHRARFITGFIGFRLRDGIQNHACASLNGGDTVFNKRRANNNTSVQVAVCGEVAHRTAVAAAALAFGGVVEKAGVIERLMAPVLERVRSNGSVVASLIGSTVATNVVTADQYIAIVLPGRMFKGSFEKRGLAPVVMSRALGDSATVTSALIPWNSCGAYMAATLGVATLAYAPFAFFCFLSPLVSIAYAYLGIRMLKQ